MPSTRSGCPGHHQPGQGVKIWVLALFCSSVQMCSVKFRGQTQRLSSCPSLGGHCCSSGLRACGTSHHRSVAAQQTWDPVMTWRCVRPSKESNLLPVHSKESWNSPVGLYPDTGLWHIFSSGMLSAVCYPNRQPFRNTECWNAPQAKKMAEKNCLDSPELSLHTFQPCLWQKYWFIQRYLLQQPTCAVPSALMEHDTSLQLVRAPWRAALSLLRGLRDWTQPAWAEHLSITFIKLLY